MSSNSVQLQHCPSEVSIRAHKSSDPTHKTGPTSEANCHLYFSPTGCSWGSHEPLLGFDRLLEWCTELNAYFCLLVCSVMSDSLQPHRLEPTRLLCPWNSPGKNTGVGCHFLLQRIFLTQGSNPSLLHWQVDSLLLSHQGSPSHFLP